jgi:hypothetical protein
MSRALPRLTGLAFAVAILISEVLKGESPSPTGRASEIVSFFADHRSTILAGAYVQMLALFLLALLFATVSEDVMPADTTAGTLARLGLVLTLTAYDVRIPHGCPGVRGCHGHNTRDREVAWEIRFVSETFVNFPVALLIGSVALAIRPKLPDLGTDGHRWSSPRCSWSAARPWPATDSSLRTGATGSSTSGFCRSG